MKTLKNWAFGLCLCGTVGLLGTSLSACGAQGGNTGAVKADTVEAALKKCGVKLGEEDRLNVAPTAKLTDGMAITVMFKQRT